MKYLREDKFKDRKGVVVQLPIKGDVLFEATVGDVLLIILRAYAPTPSFALTMPQLRNYLKLLDVLEKEPREDFIAIEDSDYAVLRSIISHITPLIPLLVSVAPLIEDAVNVATDKLPTQETSP